MARSDPFQGKDTNGIAMSPTGQVETILVVDDDKMVLGLADSMLTRFGYRVITAASGKEALRLFEKSPAVEVRLALIDLVMPEMSGIEVVQQIHKLRPGLPVLFFSGYCEDDSVRPMFARGVPFIAKPFTSLQLTRKLRELLDVPKADAESA
jgi:two-component system, cell cycle sensor histidine kinase and response regulator CckA